ncbi:CRISPR-associated protein Cas4 [Thermoanaerobacterium thermosaccharolyticum]|uniref:CRISPR-associated exonuclease Cas4 n=1 Tax=Thermoanaerobacterium thermosaccharolyticum TaxID=1517 RepID=A0A231VKT5_THETR|nr:CRISPR-associated protein Cas4 [Thermoanaerobacterium thermosaccharolyticum]OXT08895.1 CRISPR-associated protein Cas4 [Thermoanaerobacterium thermosaccharolyticum]
MNVDEKQINGTLIWYYYVCKREVWLMAHNIVADQDNEFLDLGRFIHEKSYDRDRKEISIGNIKLDVLKKNEEQLIVGEVKKSSKYAVSARMQLLFYLSKMQQMGVTAKGQLLFPEEKKREEVILDDTAIKELENAEKAIYEIMDSDVPPEQIKIPFCKNCAYLEFCWS